MFVDEESATDSSPTLAELPTERLEHEITELAAHLAAGTCRWLELVAEFDRRGVWADYACRSAAEWVAWQCALTTRAAREHVRVARRLTELPLIHEKFAEGQLSFSKVRALTRVAEPGNEEDLIELARNATASQLERIVRGLRQVSTAEAQEQQANRYLTTWWEDDGSLSIHARLSAEDGAMFLSALDAAHDRLRDEADDDRDAGDGGSAEPPAENGSAEPHPEVPSEPPRPRHQTHADALVELARGNAGYEVSVHVDLDVLSRDGPGQVRLKDGPALAPETARRLACDASLIPVLEREGHILSVGRKTRAVPPSIARAVEARDGGCRFPGCEHRRFLDKHHIIHWGWGGETDKSNLILLCRYHHRLAHEGGLRISGNADKVVYFRLPDGTRLVSAPPAPSGDVETLRALNRGAGTRIDPETCLSGIGERMDRHWVVSVVADNLYGPDPPAM
jgi:Domain of unknown function (DUF222)/HNH endonuclease